MHSGRKPQKFDLKEFRRKHRGTDFVNREYELKFVAGATSKVEILETVSTGFDSSVIASESLKWIYDKVLSFYLENGVLVDSKAFNHLVADRKGKSMLLALWKKLEARKESCTMASTIALMEKLKKLYDARNMSLCASDIIAGLSKALTSKDLNIVNSIRDKFEFYNELTIRKDIHVTTGNPADDYEEFKQKFKQIQKDPSSIMGIPTGVTAIDKQMIGLRDGEFAIMMGRTGSGKSVFIQGCAVYCAKTVGDAVVITIEMPKDQYEQRIYCALSGIPYESFRKYSLNREQWNHLDRVMQKNKKMMKKLHIIDMPEGCTVEAAASETKIWMKHRKIKLACVDYMNIMATSSSGAVSMAWEDQLQLAVQMKLKFARGLHLPTWTVVQTGEKDTAFSKHIRDQLDVGCSIREDEDSKETGVKWIDWVKTRDFLGQSVSLQTRLDIMRFSGVSKEEERTFKRINQKRRNVKV